MPNPADVLAGLPGGQHLTTTVAALLLFHVPAGLTRVITGAVTAGSPKRPHRHLRFGTVYYWALRIVLLLATGMALSR